MEEAKAPILSLVEWNCQSIRIQEAKNQDTMEPIRSTRGENSTPSIAPQGATDRLSLSQKTPLDRLIVWESADPSRCEAIKQRKWKVARI